MSPGSIQDILDIQFGELEAPDEWTDYELGSLIPIRDELMEGDLRALYIVWLAAQCMIEGYDDEEDEDEEEDCQFAPSAEAGGLLHLGSTATQCPEAGALLWLHSPMHQGQVTNAPSLPSMPDKERITRPRTFYPIADSRWEPSRSVVKEPGGEPSLSAGAECLCLHPRILLESAESGNQERRAAFIPRLNPWVSCRRSHEISVPPVSPGFTRLTEAQYSLAELFRVPQELLVAAAKHSRGAGPSTKDDFAAWVKLLSPERQNDYLVRLAHNESGLSRLLVRELRELGQGKTR